MAKSSNGKITGPVPGTYGITGENYRTRKAIIDMFEKNAQSFGYEPIELPTLYPSGTFVGKVVPRRYGNLVARVTTQFDAPNQLLELAYELTKPVALMMVQASLNQELMTQGRFAYSGTAFRMEDPEKLANARERYIAFRQLGIENFTSDPVTGAAEAIAIYIEFLRKLSLNGSVRIANTELMRNVLNDNGVNNYQRTAITALIDEGKIRELEGYILQQQLGEELIGAVKTVLKLNKNPNAAIKDIRREFPSFASVAFDLEMLVDLLNEAQILDRVAMDQSAQRGLAFYNKFGFQGDISDSREVMGGGDYKIEVNTPQKGAIELTGTGFGIGLERLESVVPELELGGAAQGILVYGDKKIDTWRALLSRQRDGARVEAFVGTQEQAREYAKLRGLTTIVSSEQTP